MQVVCKSVRMDAGAGRITAGRCGGCLGLLSCLMYKGIKPKSIDLGSLSEQ